MLVTNEGADTLAIVDTRTNSLSRTVFLPPPSNYCRLEPNFQRVFPSGIALSADGARAYIATGACAEIVVELDGYPEYIHAGGTFMNTGGIVLSPDEGLAYVSDEESRSILVVDTDARTFMPSITVGVRPRTVAISEDGASIFTCGVTGGLNSGSVSVASTELQREIAVVRVGDLPSTLALDSRGSRLYVVNDASQSISVIDTKTLEVADTLPHEPGALALSPDGARLYVSTLSGLSVVDTETYAATLFQNIPPGNLGVTPDGHSIYLLDQSTNSVLDIDSATFEVTATIVFPRQRTCQGEAYCLPVGIAIGNIVGGCAPCAGDCDGDESVRSTELVAGVEIALQRVAVGQCRALDSDISGDVTVEEIVSAVAQRLDQCRRPSSPAPD